MCSLGEMPSSINSPDIKSKFTTFLSAMINLLSHQLVVLCGNCPLPLHFHVLESGAFKAIRMSECLILSHKVTKNTVISLDSMIVNPYCYTDQAVYHTKQQINLNGKNKLIWDVWL